MSEGRVRASDAEREQFVTVLRDAMGEGRLTMSEGEERIAAAYAATYRDELPELTADLPPVEPAGSRRAGRPGPGRGGGRAGATPGPGRGHPAAGLLMLAAVATGLWALAGSGAVWLPIVLGVLALMAAKHGRHGRWHGGCGRHPGERAGAAAEADRETAGY